MERAVTPKLLASFIEYAAVGKVTPIEWNRFMVNHYRDLSMEEARRECVRITGGYAGLDCVDERVVALRLLAERLRSQT
jgi:hypothetical protein